MRTMLVLAVVTMAPCQQRPETCPPPGHVTVVAAKHDLAPGRAVVETDLELLEMPRSNVTDDALTHPASVIGRIPTERILAHEPLRPERFEGPGATPGTVTLEIPLGSAVLAPGNHVDLLVTEGTTRAVLEGRRVVDVIAPGSAHARVVVALSPAEAARVTEALVIGEPTWVLRSDADFADSDSIPER